MKDQSRRQFVQTSLGIMTLAATATGAQEQKVERATFLVVYSPGPKWLAGKPLGEQPLREHGRYMVELHRRGLLRQAGPFLDDSGGAVLLEAANIDEARALADNDPAVLQQTFSYQVHPWKLLDWAAISARSA